MVTGAFVVGRVLVNPGLPGLAAWEGVVTIWAVWVALYTAVAHGPRSRATVAVVAAVALAVIGEVVRELYFYEGGLYDGLPLNEAFGLAYNFVAVALPIALGIAVRGLRERERELAAQAAELQREREENARRAVLDERVRIARELHDVVAHHVSVMGVQAGAARRVMRAAAGAGGGGAGLDRGLEPPGRPRAAAAARLPAPRGPGRRAGARSPTSRSCPSSSPRRVATTSRSSSRSRASRGRCPARVELSAYRVIQEALTNTRKHARDPARRCASPTGRRRWRSRSSTTGAAARRRPAAGHGLIGMRERVRLHGGHLRAGPRPGGGFAVHATFPLNGRPA